MENKNQLQEIYTLGSFRRKTQLKNMNKIYLVLSILFTFFTIVTLACEYYVLYFISIIIGLIFFTEQI